MKTTQYVQLSRDVATSDRGSIRARWIYGIRLLNAEKMSPSGVSLRHGVTENLIAAGAKVGDRLSDREIPADGAP